MQKELRNKSLRVALLSDIGAIVKDLLTYANELDKKFEREVTSERPVYGLHVMPGIVLLLKHHALMIKRYTAKEFLTNYDHFMLVFPELLSIRAIRFSGKERLDASSSFLVSKLSRQKGESSKIGRNLIGSFITEGKLENIDETALQLLSPVLLELIRPFLKTNLIFPSPLSLMTHEIFVGNFSKRLFLSPCALTVILKGKNFKYVKRFQALGEMLEGLLINDGIVLAFDTSQERLEEGSLKVFLPLGGFADERFKLYQEYLKAGRSIITHLLGILVFEEKVPILKPNTQGYFLALQEMPIYLDVEALAVYGELYGFTFKFTHLSRTSQKYCAIRCRKDQVERFTQAVQRKISSLSRELNAHITFEELKIGDVTKEKLLSEYLISENHHIKLLAPPLLVPAITKGLESKVLQEILNTLQKAASCTKIEASLIFMKLNEKPWTRALLAEMSGAWKDSFNYQRDLATKHKLAYII
jgi:hypothetical protein